MIRFSVFTAFSVLLLSVVVLRPSEAVTIQINLSYKVILNSEDGTLPKGREFYDGDGKKVRTTYTKREEIEKAITSAVDEVNRVLMKNSEGRSLQYRFHHEVLYIGGKGDKISKDWFDKNFHDGDFMKEFKNESIDKPTAYAFKESWINIYINDATGGGIASYPPGRVVNIGGRAVENPMTHLHEFGHFFNLYHTYRKPDDEVQDTIKDCYDKKKKACGDGIWTWDRAEIKTNNSGSTDQQVDNLYRNTMSYRQWAPSRPIKDKLTPGQLDRWDGALKDRWNVIDGTTKSTYTFDWEAPWNNGKIVSRCYFVDGGGATLYYELHEFSEQGDVDKTWTFIPGGKVCVKATLTGNNKFWDKQKASYKGEVIVWGTPKTFSLVDITPYETTATPYGSLKTAIASVASDGKIMMSPGDYPDPITIDKPVRLESNGGIVRIGTGTKPFIEPLID